ncbi:3-hydroxyacyl-CoA dehydrogenase [Labrys wisconsinensis]|uniref:3-hydroxyacyl-CoA dehydrogenase n=1 Tax=Labrys wisconsinensis TaxID=425677 RepID=A0ABU0J0V0_9HYPH|nr:3-hydroxyacyl-CoA dehydrogenase [Labrys wisconsinensis]MDQ0467888.1 3-hydroxyacyl-CoA dehydrogenase [Labrys wisconsinensis]
MRRLETVGVVGGGLVGSGWAIVFARAGRTVRLFDASAEIRAGALAGIRRSLADMQAFGLVGDVEAIARRISVVDSLAEAVAEADYVQESVFERVDVKAAVSREIGAAIRDDAVVGSSSSGIPASAFTADVPRRERFLVAHPVNPPHLVPLVELVPAPWTDGAILPWLRQAMEELGQVPVVVNREIEGFVLNRLQGALLNEAWALYEAGLASAADIDRTVAHGLGLRWSFMGPFETIDLNAPGGVDDYARRLGPLYHAVAQARRDPRPWSDDLVGRVTRERREALPAADLKARSAWRDRRLMALVAHRRGQPDR